MTHRVRRTLEAAVGAAVVVTALAWLSGGCGDRVPPGTLEPGVQRAPENAPTASVEVVDATVVEQASGTVASARQTTVSSKILARIAAIPVTAGSVVAEGDVLVQMDSRDLEARAREAEEALGGARARLELARTELARVERLFASKVASRQQLDQTRSGFEVARSEVEAAEQRLREARVALSYAEIRAPVAGRIVDRLAEPGDTVAPGVPLLRLYDPSALRLEAPVRETLAVKLDPGQVLSVRIEALASSFEGSIEEIVPFAEPGARTLLVKVRLPPHPDLVAGMFGRIAVPAGERRRLLVPGEAVSRMGQLEFVSVVGPEGTLERRLVTTGPSRDGAVEVLSGLAAGERVLLPGGPQPEG
jgi:membrane fusion protein (multidrug efflux system)